MMAIGHGAGVFWDFLTEVMSSISFLIPSPVKDVTTPSNKCLIVSYRG